MRKIIAILAIALPAFLLTGCDFIRSLGGRPTSSDITAKKILIEQKRRAEAEQELLALQEAAPAEPEATVSSQDIPEEAPKPGRVVDDPEILSSLIAEGMQVKKASSLKSFPSSQVETKYCIIVGAFGVKENADKVVAAATRAGFKAVELNYRSGMVGVGIIPSNSIVEVYNLFQKAKSESFCPKDAWLLVKE